MLEEMRCRQPYYPHHYNIKTGQINAINAESGFVYVYGTKNIKAGPLQYSRCINHHCHMPIVYNLVSLIPPPHKNANNVREHPLTSGTKYALRIV